MDSVEQICRFCLDAKNLQTSLSLYDSAVQAKISTVFNFPFDSRTSLPSSVCINCFLKINEFFEFTETVRQNQEQLISRKASLSQVNIKLEQIESLVEDPAVKLESFIEPTAFDQKSIKAEAAGEVVNEGDEAYVVSFDQDQGETLQFKIEFEGTELQIEENPNKKRAKTVEEEDQRIKDFFSLNCETCLAPYGSYTRLKLHTTVAHNKKLIFKCCNKELSQRYKLLDHIAVHLNPNQFQCDTCDKTFQQKCDLANHRVRAHTAEEEKTFKCNQCSATFPKQHLLKYHLNRHIPAKCEICQKVVSNSVALRTHKKLVHDRIRHKCDVCGKEFCSKSELCRHKTKLHVA